VIGRNSQTGHRVLIREKNRIGNDVSIGSNSCIEHHIKIEDRVRIHSQVFIAEFSVLEEGCWIGPKAVFTNAYHPLCPKVKECLRGPTIKRGAKIGAKFYHSAQYYHWRRSLNWSWLSGGRRCSFKESGGRQSSSSNKEYQRFNLSLWIDR
jgi:hypothetical protein